MIQKNSGASILRYTLAERVIHWIAGLTYVFQFLTGLAFYSPHLYWIAIVLGGAPTSCYWHPWLGLLFSARAVPDVSDLAGGHAHHRTGSCVGQSDGPLHPQ